MQISSFSVLYNRSLVLTTRRFEHPVLFPTSKRRLIVCEAGLSTYLSGPMKQAKVRHRCTLLRIYPAMVSELGHDSVGA